MDAPSRPRHRRRTARPVAAVITLVAAVLGVVATASVAAGDPPPAEPVRLVIDDPDAARTLAADPDIDLVLADDDFAVVTVDPAEVTAAARQAREAGAGTVERDVEVYPAAVTPTDPGWPSWWGATQLGLPNAWEYSLGTPTLAIAVIDTGVNVVPELAGRVRPGRSYVDDNPTQDTDGHGTSVAMVAAGAMNNGTGATGSCPQCDIIPIKVIANLGSSALLSNVAAGINWAVDNGAAVVNISLSGTQTISALSTAVNNAQAAGVVVVAAAGNAGNNLNCSSPITKPCATTPQYPASLNNVVGVAARGADGTLASYSSRGTNVELAAAGTNVVATAQFGSWANFSGTSSASPLVAGTVALYRSLDAGASVADIRSRLQSASPMPAPALNVAWGALNGPALLAQAPPGWPPAPFTDVVRPSYYAVAVDWAYDTGVTTGTSPTTFAPAMTINRAQAIAMLWRMAGEPTPTGPNPFSDVPAGSYFDDATAWAYEQGITTGIDGTDRFAPQRVLTRAQAVTLVWRTDGEPAPTAPNPFTDVPAGSWFDDATAWAAEQGITTGVGGSDRFEPARDIVRAQHIAMLWRWVGSPPAPA